MNQEFYVYELQYPDGTPFYVGKGKGNRCNQHLHKSNKNNLIKDKIINKIRSNNQEPIIEKIVENLTELVAFEIEKSLISYYGRRNNKTGILANLTDGGEGPCGRIVGRDEILKRREMMLGKNNPMYGREISEEHRKKLVESHLGITHSEETKQKISSISRGRQHTVGSKLKISIGKLGKNNPMYGKIGEFHPRSKKVIQYTKDGDFIAIFDSLLGAERTTKISSSNIWKVCNDKAKTSGGFKWKYL